MDWKYILSLSLDNLSENEKDKLYDSVVWFDIESEKLDNRKCITLLKISQEIMKYKSEQVEALLAELDEVATRHGEEEAKKNSEEDEMHSKKSASSTNYDDLRQKYKDVRQKLKQQVKDNEAQKQELEKMKQVNAALEDEKSHLKYELQTALNRAEDSQSEMSESVTDQQKELLQTVRKKNKQVSQLLSDIEEIEKENLNLKENISNLKEQLSDATNQISLTTNDLTSLKVKLDDCNETINNLKAENETLQSQIQDFLTEKEQRDNEIDEFAVEIDTRIDNWKEILQEKDEEIRKLKNHLQRLSPHSSETSLSIDESKPYVEVLNKAINERDEQLIELQKQLQSATVEMERSTKLLKRLTSDKNSALNKISEQSKIIKGLKKRLRAAHKRSQELQDDISLSESTTGDERQDFDELVYKLKHEGKIDVSESLEHIQKLKLMILEKDKQVSDYIKLISRLKESYEEIETENALLRNRLADTNVGETLLKSQKDRKISSKLQKQFKVLEEENVNLKLKIEKLKNSVPEGNGNSELIEENEALRKGLHEILESIKLKNETSRREIKSEILEKLLRALDSRHVSGWYHPAMRLQAELQTLQGINTELREQLKMTRMQLNQSDFQKTVLQKSAIQKSEDFAVPYLNIQNMPATTKEMITELNEHLLKILNNYHKEENMNSMLVTNLEKYQNSFEVTEQQLNLVYKQYQEEKQLWKNEKDTLESDRNKLEDDVAILEAKLKEFLNSDEDEIKKSERFAEISSNMVMLNRKCVFLENQENKLSTEVAKLKNDLAEAEVATFEKISQLKIKNEDLLKKLIESDDISPAFVERRTLTEIQNQLDSVTLKYRNMLQSYNSLKEERSDDFHVLTKTIELLEKQKTELKNNLVECLTKEHIHQTLVADNNVESLSRKLAQSEVSEIAEKQRANHMSNLYNLVKEQLSKSEQRFLEFQKQSQETSQKNLIFQENIKDLENRLIGCVDLDVYKELESKHSNCKTEMQTLSLGKKEIENELMVMKKSLVFQDLSLGSKDLEILNLKHQILDLQASGDDKALIARLSSDVVLARLSETQFKKRQESLELELKECQNNCDVLKNLMEQTKIQKDSSNSLLKQKLNTLENIIRQQRLQYLGSTPLFSEEVSVSNIKQTIADKQAAFKLLQKFLKQEYDVSLLKEQLNKQIKLTEELQKTLEECPENFKNKLQTVYQEQKLIQLKELKFNREIDFKNMQLKQLSYRLNTQDDLIIKLQEELLQCYSKHDYLPSEEQDEEELHKIIKPAVISDSRKMLKEQEIQTSPELLQSLSNENSMHEMISNMQSEVNSAESAMKEKDAAIEQLRSKITELEMNVSLFRSQIGDKQSQITFYEKHILDLQNKLGKANAEALAAELSVSSVIPQNADEIMLLKEALKKLKEINTQKDGDVLKYQTLLKQDRDEHSLAAARMQQELKRFQEMISTQEKAYKELKETSIQHPGRAAIEHYIHQVHALERHTAELHTTVSSLNSQLQASRQEASRWQTLANERLDSMEELRNDIEEQHQNEIASYKRDSERWREEISRLKQSMSKHRTDVNHEVDLNLKLKEKDELHPSLGTIYERTEQSVDKADTYRSDISNEQLFKEHQVLKRQYEQIITRERNAKDEIHKLKEQLLKRPVSARSDRSEKELQLQKKVNALEKENEDLKQKLEKQIVISEAHKIAVNDDFDKWKKQKYWQQLSEKLKTKLNEKTEEYNKLNQSCASYKVLIERLEREKHSLENKVKTLRAGSASTDATQLDVLQMENEQLHLELESLNSKLHMQQHHSGGLGAAMLQEKLEAQERKIAVLELSSKGSVEIRNELDHLQSTVANLQKINLRLEAENLELKLDLEKCGNDAPRLHEQIQHLERYIDVLKSENQNMHLMSEAGDQVHQTVNSKKMAELEKTVFVLKRVVEKLQVENKKLQGGGRACSVTGRSTPDAHHIKERYSESVQKITRLENQLKLSNDKIMSLEKRSLSAEVTSLSSELSQVKAELSHKSLLLDKVKVLLHRAAAKEKTLMDEISALKSLGSSGTCSTENALD